MERVKSSDVLDPTHVGSRRWRGEVLGHFRRLGPNSWDDYQFVRASASGSATTGDQCETRDSKDAPPILEILPQVPLQLEAHGAVVRLRSGGRVVRVRWLADPEDERSLGRAAEAAQIRRYFVDRYLQPLAGEAVLGAAGVVVKKLGDL